MSDANTFYTPDDVERVIKYYTDKVATDIWSRIASIPLTELTADGWRDRDPYFVRGEAAKIAYEYTNRSKSE